MPEVSILQVVPRLESGGSEQATVEIAEALTRAGAKALVATEGGRMAIGVTQAGGEIVTLPVASKNPFTILANAKRLERLIKERDVALVHARSRAPAWSAYLAARRTGRSFVTTYHGAYGALGPLKAAYNSVMGRGDRVIANSQYTASLVTARHHLPEKFIRQIYRGIDEAAFDPLMVRSGPVAKLRERWGVSQGTKIVLQAARLTGLKGHRLTIKAATAPREGVLDNAVIVFAGDAPGKDAYCQELIRLITRHGLEDKVRLVGHCRDMPAAFLTAHVAIVPSLVPETFGRTSIEAQAMGCPVIFPISALCPRPLSPPNRTKRALQVGLCPRETQRRLRGPSARHSRYRPKNVTRLALRASIRASADFALAQMQMKTLAVYDELLGTHLVQAWSAGRSPA